MSAEAERLGHYSAARRAFLGDGLLCNRTIQQTHFESFTPILPTTSCLIESQVTEINYRGKGTEKFWNDGPSGDAILHLRAAAISDGNKLADHFAARPGRHYTRQSRKDKQLAMN